MSKWSDFYIDRMNVEYLKHIRTKYLPFINEIKNNIKPGIEYVAEAGAGMANITRILLEDNIGDFNFQIVEPDKDMLKLAQMNLKDFKKDSIMFYNLLAQHCYFKEESIVISHGVLEHLSDEDINRIRSICTQAGIALYHAYLYEEAQKSVQKHDEFTHGRRLRFLFPLDQAADTSAMNEYLIRRQKVTAKGKRPNLATDKH